jgi:CRP-like cAMP-binding protein
MSGLQIGRAPTDNSVIAALPPEERERLLAVLTRVPLERGRILHAPGDAIDHVYFPLDGVISFVVRLSDGSAVEAGLIGREGYLGAPVILGTSTAPTEAMAQIAGEAMRGSVADLVAEFSRGESVHRCMLRYLQAMIIQISQTASCNRLHEIEERLCRWLLMSHDRVRSDEIGLTHEFLATMLGTGRPGVTRAVGALEDASLVVQKRGAIRIVSREGLEQLSCECYAAVREEYDRYKLDIGLHDRD